MNISNDLNNSNKYKKYVKKGEVIKQTDFNIKIIKQQTMDLF